MSFRSLLLFLALALLVSCARPVPDEPVTAETPDFSATVEATETEALIAAARSAFQDTQPTQGGAYLQAYIERQDADAAALRAYMVAEEFEERDLAIALLEIAWQARPSRTIASHLGELYWRSGQLEEVGVLFDELLEHAEDGDDTLRFAGRFASRRFLTGLAEDLAMRAFAPEDPFRLLAQAQLRDRVGDTSGAHRSLGAFLDEADDLLPSLELSILVTLERWTEAEELARAILASPEPRYLVRWSDYRPGDELPWTTPENPQPQLLTLAKILEAQGRHDEALRLFDGLESFAYDVQSPTGRHYGIAVSILYPNLFDEGRYGLAYHIANETAETSPGYMHRLLVYLYTRGQHEEFNALLDRVFDGTGASGLWERWNRLLITQNEVNLAIVLGIYERTQDPSLYRLLARALIVDSPLTSEAVRILREDFPAADRIELANGYTSRPATALTLIEGLDPEDHPEVLEVLRRVYRFGPHTGFQNRASEVLEHPAYPSPRGLEEEAQERDLQYYFEARLFTQAEPLLLERLDELDDPDLLSQAISGLLQEHRERTALLLTEALLRHGTSQQQGVAFRTRMNLTRVGGHDLDVTQEVERFLSYARDADQATALVIEQFLSLGHDQGAAPLLDELLERDIESSLDLLFERAQWAWKLLSQAQIELVLEMLTEMGVSDEAFPLILHDIGPMFSDEDFQWLRKVMEQTRPFNVHDYIGLVGTHLYRFDEENAWREAWRGRRLLEVYDIERSGRAMEASANQARAFEFVANGIKDLTSSDPSHRNIPVAYRFLAVPYVHGFLAHPDPEMVAIGEHYLRGLSLDSARYRRASLEVMRPDLLLHLSDHDLADPEFMAEIAPDLARLQEVPQTRDAATTEGPTHTEESLQRSARRAQLDGDHARHEALLDELSGELHLAPIVAPAMVRWQGSLDAAAVVLAGVAELPAAAIFLHAPADVIPRGDGIREETYVRVAHALIELDQADEALALLDAQAEALRYRPDDVTILRWLAGESELFAMEDVHFVYHARVAEHLVDRGQWEEAAAFDHRLAQLLLGQRILEDPTAAREVVEEYLASIPDPGRGMERVFETLSRVGQAELANEMARSLLEQDRSDRTIRRLMPHLIATAEPADAESLADFAIGTEGRQQGPLKGGEYRVLRRYLQAVEPDTLLATLDEADFYDRTWNRILRAQIHFRAGLVDSGRTEILEVLEGLGPNYLNVTVLVDELLADGLYLEVARTIAPAVPDDQVNARLAAAFALSELMLRQEDAAEAWLSRVDETSPQPQFWRMDIADTLVRHGEFQGISRALGDAPDVPHVRYLRALAVLAQGGAEASDAVSAISQAADQGVHLVASHYNALLAASAGECTACLDVILASLAERAGPEDWDGLEQAARLHGSLTGSAIESDSLDAAIQDARTALLVATAPAPADYHRLGHLLHQSGDLVAAETALRTGLRTWAEGLRTWTDGSDHPASELRLLSSTLAEVLTDQGEHDRALGWHTAAQRLPVSPY